MWKLEDMNAEAGVVANDRHESAIARRRDNRDLVRIGGSWVEADRVPALEGWEV